MFVCVCVTFVGDATLNHWTNLIIIMFTWFYSLLSLSSSFSLSDFSFLSFSSSKFVTESVCVHVRSKRVDDLFLLVKKCILLLSCLLVFFWSNCLCGLSWQHFMLFAIRNCYAFHISFFVGRWAAVRGWLEEDKEYGIVEGNGKEAKPMEIYGEREKITQFFILVSLNPVEPQHWERKKNSAAAAQIQEHTHSYISHSI